jgi:hypothetical protein
MGPGEKARTAHPRRRDDLGVAVRNTNPRRIRRYAKLVEIMLPSDDFVMAAHEKAAGDHASGQIRVRKRIRVEMSPAPVGPRSTGKSWISVLKTKHRNRPISNRRPTVAAWHG